MEEYQIIRFKTGSLQLDVRISPNEDTVWLTKDQIALLFNRDRSVISRHIKNIFDEEELNENQVCAKNARTALDGKIYQVDFYNLDVVISVGYRVKSKNGVIFRKWANNILREYLLKGFIINDERCLLSKENISVLSKRVNLLEDKIETINQTIKIFSPNEKIIQENQSYTAFLYINKLLREAEKRIVIIDGYLDESSLEFFSNVNQNIEITLITHKANRIREYILKRFKEEFVNATLIENRSFHDRFIIVDDKVYSIGTSLNNLGNKLTTIKVMENTNANDLIANILSEKNFLI